jgi:hypothetical protein
MIILWSTLTTFELSCIFVGSWGSNENWLEPIFTYESTGFKATTTKFAYSLH